MKESLSPRRAFSLYALVLTFVFVSFLLGLLVGSGGADRPDTAPVVPEYPPVKDVETQLDFYDELSKPAEPVERAPVVEVVKTPVRSDPVPTVESKPARDDRVSETEAAAYTIQVAAHSTEDEARQILMLLRANHIEGRIRPPDSARVDDYYRVWVGEFSSAEAAGSLEAELKEKGFHTYIRTID